MGGDGSRYSNRDDMTAFGFLINALEGKKGGDGDTGVSFPRTDAEDLSRGARFIPGEVTLARRAGEKVQFVTNCRCHCCWYWQMPDGSKIYHYDPDEYEQLKKKGCCPHCGNTHISGGTVKAS